MMGRIALFVEMAGKRCLVVGGGKAAFEKAAKLLRSGAAVTVVALEFTPEFAPTAGDEPLAMRCETRAYAPGEAAGYDFVVAASGDEAVDLRVLADSAGAGRLANIASRDDGGGCMLGAELCRGDVAIAVSTGGASPSLAASLRDLVGATVTPWHGTLAVAFSRIKTRLREDGYSAETRRGVLRRLASPGDWPGLEGAESVDRLEALLWNRAQAHLAGMDEERK